MPVFIVDELNMGSRFLSKFDVVLIEEAKRITYESIPDVVPLFPAGQELPVIIGETSHPYFMLYRVKGPTELTDASHPLYHNEDQRYRRAYEKPELAVKLVHPSSVEIRWQEAILSSPHSNPMVIPYREAMKWQNINSGYLVLIPYNPLLDEQTKPQFLIAGQREVEEQLREWGITDLGIEGLL